MSAVIEATSNDTRYDRGLYTLKSFSGTDIKAYVSISPWRHDIQHSGEDTLFELGNIHTLTYSSYREKSPVRTLARIGPKQFVSGPRTIAGSLIFTVFNKDPLLDLMWTMRKKDLDVSKTASNAINYANPDQLPPFEILLRGLTEGGYEAYMTLYGIELVSEGHVISVDDIYTEKQYQFVARDKSPIIPIEFGTVDMGNGTIIRTGEESKITTQKGYTFNDLMYGPIAQKLITRSRDIFY